MIEDKIRKLQQMITADQVLKFVYPLTGVESINDWSLIPENTILNLGVFHLDTTSTDSEPLKEYYEIDTRKWRWIGGLWSNDEVLQNTEDNKLYLLTGDDYLLQNFPAKEFGEYEYFIDHYVLGERYLELTEGFEDKWYELLVRAGFANK